MAKFQIDGTVFKENGESAAMVFSIDAENINQAASFFGGGVLITDMTGVQRVELDFKTLRPE